MTQEDIPLFSEKIIAWDFGPVVLEVYNFYSRFGCGSLYRKKKEEPFISEKDKFLINDVLEMFADYSSTDLVHLTQHQDPWKISYIASESREISHMCLKRYFEN